MLGDREMKKAIGATYGVITSVFEGNVEENYDFKFEERAKLHEHSPSHVQAVNQYLDKKGVDLEKEHLPHFERGTQIDNFQVKEQGDNGRKHWKTIKNERKLADSFHKEAEDERKKGADANQTKINYAMAGYLSHTLFGSFKAMTNPYVAHEDDLGIGVTHDYLDNQRK